MRQICSGFFAANVEEQEDILRSISRKWTIINANESLLLRLLKSSGMIQSALTSKHSIGKLNNMHLNNKAM